MHFLYASAALAATATLSLAAPAADVVGRKTFQVQQVASGKVRKNGPIQMMKAYEKYARVGAQAPPSVVKAAAAAQQSGSVAANPQEMDEAYLCPVRQLCLPSSLRQLLIFAFRSTLVAQLSTSTLTLVPRISGSSLRSCPRASRADTRSTTRASLARKSRAPLGTSL